MDPKDFSKFIKEMTDNKMTSLVIDFNILTPDQIKELIEKIRTNSSIHNLTLENYAGHHDNLQLLLNALIHNENMPLKWIRLLDMRGLEGTGAKFNTDCAKSLAQLINQRRALLYQISFNSVYFNPEDLKLITEAFRKNLTLLGFDGLMQNKSRLLIPFNQRVHNPETAKKPLSYVGKMSSDTNVAASASATDVKEGMDNTGAKDIDLGKSSYESDEGRDKRFSHPAIKVNSFTASIISTLSFYDAQGVIIDANHTNAFAHMLKNCIAAALDEDKINKDRFIDDIVVLASKIFHEKTIPEKQRHSMVLKLKDWLLSIEETNIKHEYCRMIANPPQTLLRDFEVVAYRWAVDPTSLKYTLDTLSQNSSSSLDLTLESNNGLLNSDALEKVVETLRNRKCLMKLEITADNLDPASEKLIAELINTHPIVNLYLEGNFNLNEHSPIIQAVLNSKTITWTAPLTKDATLNERICSVCSQNNRKIPRAEDQRISYTVLPSFAQYRARMRTVPAPSSKDMSSAKPAASK